MKYIYSYALHSFSIWNVGIYVYKYTYIYFRFPNEPAFIIPNCLREKVDAGDLGRKSGKGFYVWDGDKRGDPV